MKNHFQKFFLLIFISCSHFLVAQNSFLVFADRGMYPFVGNDLNDDLNQHNGLIQPMQYKIPPVPAELKQVAPQLHINYARGLNRLLNSFQLEHLTYKQILTPYSIFGLGNYPVINLLPYNDTLGGNQDSVSLVTLRAAVFQKSGLLDIIYAWAMPSYQNAFSVMSVPEQDDYLKLLEETKAYAVNFDLKKEKHDLDSLQNEFTSVKGKLNAFVYRRIANNELTKAACISWLNKIISDLQSVKRKTATPADNYVLYSAMDGNYFLAADYKNISAHHRKTKIIHLANGTSTVIDSISYSDIKYASADLVLGPSEKVDGKSTYRLFYCDTTGYRTFLLPQEEVGINDIALGKGNDKRILIMNGADASQSHVLCSVYDLDSGKVVLKSFWVGALPTEDPYSSQVLYNIEVTGGMLLIMGADGMQGLMDVNGNVVLPAIYKSITFDEKSGEFILNKKKHFKAG